MSERTIRLIMGFALIGFPDNGRGISGDGMTKLFKMFRRLGGRVWCESEPGKGSTFTFTMPHVFEQDATSPAAGRES